jgi:hypothetical protein
VTAQLFDFPAPEPIKPKAKKAKPKANSYTEEFEVKIWQPYPRKLNCSKFEAFKAWARLPSECQAQAMLAVPTFVRLCAGKDEAYIPHCATWLNQRRFETVVVAVPRPTMSGPAVDWPAVMKLYRLTSNWKQEFGPAPGYPGCRVPKELLDIGSTNR